MLKFNKVYFNITFFLLLIVSVIFDYFYEFIIAFVMITIHELCHIILAKYYKLKVGKITITGIGEKVDVYNISELERYKRILIYIIGPLSNFIMALVFYYIKDYTVMIINISIAVFNLIPIYPLDGGKILLEILTKYFGIIRSNKIVCKVSIILGIVIFIIGFLQLIMFSYNVSLLLLGLYVIKINKSEYFNLTFQFYRNVMKKVTKKCNKFMRVKEFFVNDKITIKEVFHRINFDDFMVFNVVDSQNTLYKIDENQILNHIQINGLSGRLQDLIKNIA